LKRVLIARQLLHAYNNTRHRLNLAQ
jgi:hypothetical protein